MLYKPIGDLLLQLVIRHDLVPDALKLLSVHGVARNHEFPPLILVGVGEAQCSYMPNVVGRNVLVHVGRVPVLRVRCKVGPEEGLEEACGADECALDWLGAEVCPAVALDVESSR